MRTEVVNLREVKPGDRVVQRTTSGQVAWVSTVTAIDKHKIELEKTTAIDVAQFANGVEIVVKS